MKILRLLSSLFAATLLAAGLAGAEDTIVLGTSLSITGKYSISGKGARDGYELAVRRVNEKGGVKIGGKSYKLKFIFEDDASDAAKGAQIFEKLMTKDALRFMVGPYSTPLTGPTSEVTEKHGGIMIDCCGADRALFRRGYKGFFGVLSTAEKYLSPAVDLLASAAENSGKDTKTIKIAVAVEPEPFSRDVRAGVLDEAKRYGMQVVLNEELPKDLNDMTAILEKVKQVKPDALFVTGHDKGATTAAKQIGEMKVYVPMVALTQCDTAHLAEKFTSAEYFVCSSQWDDSLPFRDPWVGTAKDFADEFEKAYHYKAAYIPAQAAAAVLVYVNAFERANSLDVAKVREAIATTNLRTFFGVVRFEENGTNPARSPLLFQIQKGQLKIVYPSQWEESKLIFPTPSWSNR